MVGGNPQPCIFLPQYKHEDAGKEGVERYGQGR